MNFFKSITKSNIYLDALEFGEESLNNGTPVSFESLKTYLEKKGYVFDTVDKIKLLSNFARENFNIYIGNDWEKDLQHLNTQGYFALLDYRELKEARESSREARWLAIIAILISIVFGGIQIFKDQIVSVSNMPITQDVRVRNDSFNVNVSNLPETQNVQVINSIRIKD